MATKEKNKLGGLRWSCLCAVSTVSFILTMLTIIIMIIISNHKLVNLKFYMQNQNYFLFFFIQNQC